MVWTERGSGFGYGDGDGYGYGDGDGDGYGDGFGFGFGSGSGSGDGDGDDVGKCDGYVATIRRPFGVLRVGCEVHTLDEWIAKADEIDAKHGDGIADQTRALAARLKEESGGTGGEA